MKTPDKIIRKRGKAYISSLNLKKLTKAMLIIIGSVIGLIVWAIIKPILKGAGWVISAITALAIIYLILTL